MVILSWIVKLIKKYWKKIIVVSVGLIVFSSISVIGFKLYIIGYISVKKVGEIETYDGYIMREYDALTRERFLTQLEMWRERGWSSEDIGAVLENILQYEDNVLIIYSNHPIKYLYYYRNDQQEVVYGSYDYGKGEGGTKIYVYITE